MERVIKFRAWVSDTKKMVSWDEICQYENQGMANLHDYLKPQREGCECFVMQFTGLLDNNGKEIYSGDIVKTGTDKPMVVTWSERFASFCIERDGWAFKHWFGEAFESTDCEVIGNIHQNPELL